MNKEHSILTNLLLYAVFAFYILILFFLVFMKRSSFQSINMIPFRSIISYLFDDDLIIRSFAFSNIAGNIVLFIPLGGYITLFNHDKRLYKNLFYIVLISTSIEIMQYVFKVGASDIDDVILNGLGGTIGILIYKGLLFIQKDTKKVRYTVAIFAPIVFIIFLLALFIYNGI